MGSSRLPTQVRLARKWEWEAGWRRAALAAWSGFRRLGHTMLPSISPCFPRGHVWTMAWDAGDLHHLPRRAWRDKAAFSSAPELWGSGGWGARGTQRAPRQPPTASPQTMAALCWGFTRPAPFPAAQLVTFYHLHILMGIQRAQMHHETTKRSLPPHRSPSPVPQHPQGSRAGMNRGDARTGNLPLELFQV